MSELYEAMLRLQTERGPTREQLQEICEAILALASVSRESRAIKFRAWIPQAKEWISDIDLKDLWQSGRSFEDHGTSRYEAENMRGVSWKFDDLVFMQFTGLFDRLKVGIYEGDIVRVEDSADGAIEYSGSEFIIRTEKDRMRLNDMAPGYIEIIGNIYE